MKCHEEDYKYSFVVFVLEKKNIASLNAMIIFT